MAGSRDIADFGSLDLLENASAAFLEGVKRRMGHLRRAVTNGDIDSDALSAAEKLQWTGWQRRDEINGMVRNLHGLGHSIKGIVRTTQGDCISAGCDEA